MPRIRLQLKGWKKSSKWARMKLHDQEGSSRGLECSCSGRKRSSKGLECSYRVEEAAKVCHAAKGSQRKK
jgi:hypothetical protein